MRKLVRSLLLLVPFVTAAIVRAADGELDPSFGNGGRVVAPRVSPFEEIRDVLWQADGKYVIAGVTSIAFDVNDSLQLILARYDSAGNLDPSFGTNGVTVVPDGITVTRGLVGARVPVAVTFDDAGRILLVSDITPFSHPSVYRFTPNGGPDPAFGAGGRVTLDILSQFRGMARQSDGKLIITDSRNVIRMNVDGTRDMSFGSGGMVTSAIDRALTCAAIQADGKILLGGQDLTSNGRLTFAVERLNPDGSSDTSFDGDGMAFTQFFPDFNLSSMVTTLVVQADGKIVAGGFADVGSFAEPKWALARYNSDGSADTTFDGDGRLITDANGRANVIKRVLVQADGKIVVTGTRNQYTGQDDFAVARYNADGQLDAGFGSGGISAIDFAGRRDEPNSIVLQPDGKIVAAGLATTASTGRDFALARLLPNGGLDSGFGTQGKVISTLFSLQIGFTDLAFQADGKIVAGGTCGGVFVVARYLPTGALDTSFAVNGVGTTEFDNVYGVNFDGLNSPATFEDVKLVSLGIQSNGRIIAAGDMDSRPAFFFARWNADGSLDSTFNGDGRLEEDHVTDAFYGNQGFKEMVVEADDRVLSTSITRPSFDPLSTNSSVGRRSFDGGPGGASATSGLYEFATVASYFDGKPVAAGGDNLFALPERFAVARILGTGGFDPSFDGDGVAVTDVVSGQPERATGIAVQADGKIVVGGGVASTNVFGSGATGYRTIGESQTNIGGDLALVRYNADGSLDSSFGNGGKLIADFGATEATFSLALLENGKILLAGFTRAASGSRDFLIARFNGNGSVDTSFGVNGQAVTDFGGNDVISEIAVEPNGRIVAAGYPGLARYLANSGPAATPSPTPVPTPTPTAAPCTQTPVKFTNAAAIAITDGATAPTAANPYPSTITVSGMPGTVTGVTAKIVNLNHDIPSDVDILLVSPDGQYSILMADLGTSTGDPATNVSITFDDTKPEMSFTGSGSFRPTNAGGVSFPAPAPAVSPSSGQALLNRFNGGNPNGDWKLFVVDDNRARATGSIAGGWELSITSCVQSTPTPTPTATPVPGPPRLLNISTRLGVQTGENVLIGGFILTGNKPKKVIVRAIGPSLANAGIQGALANPTLEIYNGFGQLLSSNDNWKDTQQAEIVATTIPPGNDSESAVVTGLFAANNAYTAVVRGNSNTTGVALIEAYDLDPTGNSQLANISTRGLVQTGESVMIGGFIVSAGSTDARVVVRAIGPSLGAAGIQGALADPTLQLVNANGATLRSNDNWKTDQLAEIQATGIAPTNDFESALLANLPAGNYTAIVRGNNNTTGVAVVEVYNLPGM